MEGIEKITARIIEDAEREIAQMQQENEEKISGIRGEVKDIAWGNQIRSYVLQPYTMVKDHRTGASSGNAGAVLDGDIDLFISAYLRWLSTGEKVSEDTGE